MASDKLKPCPFCGGEVDFIDRIEARCFAVVCMSCYADGPMGDTESHAADLWNKRRTKSIPNIASSSGNFTRAFDQGSIVLLPHGSSGHSKGVVESKPQ